MTTELELKFSIDGDRAPTDETVAGAFEGTELRIEPRGRLAHADRYYDDPRLGLSRAGVALRRRIGGGRIVATLKTRGRVIGALHEREEVEFPMEGRAWPEPILDRVSAITDPEALKGRFELETERRRFVVHGPDGTLAEVSIDQVDASRPTGGRTVSFAEIEVEDRGGGPVALERIAARLADVVELRPSDETKLEKARRLLLGADG